MNDQTRNAKQNNLNSLKGKRYVFIDEPQTTAIGGLMKFRPSKPSKSIRNNWKTPTR